MKQNVIFNIAANKNPGSPRGVSASNRSNPSRPLRGARSTIATQAVQLEFVVQEGVAEPAGDLLLQRYRAVTPERLHEVARRYLRPDDLAILVVGDAKALESALTPFGQIMRLSAEPTVPSTP